jgi:hypothetical protein
MAGFHQRRGKELAQRFIVFRQKDMCHACEPCPSPYKTLYRAKL